MQERGDLIRDESGRWVEGPRLDWNALPTRVEAVISERIDRLPKALREALTVASVEGETFTAEVLARILSIEERVLVRRLGGELEKQHHLIRAQGIRRLGSQRLSHYRFRHILFQTHLYHSLDQVEQTYFHEEVATALETVYGGQVEEIAAIAGQLAWHFEKADLTEKAVTYLHQAGERAIRLSAHGEAVAYLTKGLALLETQPESSERAQQELMLLLALGAPLGTLKSSSAPEVGQLYERARELCRQVGEMSQLFQVLYGLWDHYTLQAEWQTSLEFAEQCLHLAQDQADLTNLLLAHRMMGVTLLYLGEYKSAREHFEQGIALYDPELHRPLAFRYGNDPGVACLAFGAWSLWYLGYPDQALKKAREALTLAQELTHPYVLSFALSVAAEIHRLRRERRATQEQTKARLALATEHEIRHHMTTGMVFWGSILVEQGEIEVGISQMQQGLATLRGMQAEHLLPFFLARLAEAYRQIGRPRDGLKALDEAVALVEKTETRIFEAESYRLQGELLLKAEAGINRPRRRQNDERSPEACFLKAIEVARWQQAKSLELRAALSLSRLWQTQGKQAEARQLLAEIYGWFTEGFDTLDLIEAKALLESLS